MTPWTERGLWVGSLVIVVVTVSSLRNEPIARVPTRSPAPTIAQFRSKSTATPRVDVVIEGNLFRPERNPAPPEIKSAPRPEPPPRAAEAKPRLQLRGILGGPPWTALIEGIPGRQGARVVREGDLISGFTIVAINKESVTVTRPDTSWILTVGKP